MAKDPRESSDSKSGNNGKGTNGKGITPGNRNSVAWISLFWLTAALAMVNTLAIAAVPEIEGSVTDYLSMLIGIVSLGGLFGFAYYKPLLTVVFWRYFFYVALLDFVFFYLLWPLFGLKSFGQEVRFDAGYAVFFVYNIAILYALNQYAYKRPFIWLEPPSNQ